MCDNVCCNFFFFLKSRWMERKPCCPVSQAWQIASLHHSSYLCRTQVVAGTGPRRTNDLPAIVLFSFRRRGMNYWKACSQRTGDAPGTRGDKGRALRILVGGGHDVRDPCRHQTLQMNHPPTESGAATRIALLPLVLRASALLIELVSSIVFLSLSLDLSLPIFLSRSLLPHPSSHLFLFHHSRTAILHFTANLFFRRFALCECVCETEKVERGVERGGGWGRGWTLGGRGE